MNKFFLLASLFSFSSCTMYKQNFDCPVGKGVSCKSLTQIEEMIIEKEQGADLFIESVEADCSNCKGGSLKMASYVKDSSEFSHRIWVEPRVSEMGYLVEGHYIYFASASSFLGVR